MPIKPNALSRITVLAFALQGTVTTTMANQTPPPQEKESVKDYCDTPDNSACTICTPPKPKYIFT